MNRRGPFEILADTALLPMASRSGLYGRLGPILDAATDRREVPAWAVVGAVAMAAAVVPLLSAVRFTRADPPPSVGRPAAARASNTQPVVDAAALVREVRAAEAWVDRVDSFRCRIEDTWSSPHPKPDDDLGHGFVESGFDQRRLYDRFVLPNSDEFISAWDGSVAWGYERYDKPQPMTTVGGKSVVSNDVYGLRGPDLTHVAESFGGHLAWGRAGRHHPWWKKGMHGPGDEAAGLPGDFRTIGLTTYRGVPCHMLENGVAAEVWYVGTADHRLYGLLEQARSLSVTDEQTLAAEEQVARDHGHVLHGEKEFDAWDATLSNAESMHVWNIEFPRKMRRYATDPSTEFWYADYREVSPGCWFPMRQGYDMWNTWDQKKRAAPGSPPETQRAERVTEIAVNRPLPEAWFARDWTEGVPVNDFGHKPMLSYRYKKHFAPAEWQVVLDEATARQAADDARTKELHAAIGRPAPEFPPTWVQGKPVTLADLKGKVTIVDFWATWCAPCRNDVPSLNGFAVRAEKSGIGILSVHAAGTSVDDVRRAIADEKINYPVCVDLGKQAWKGPVFAAAHVVQLPSAMVIDRDGKIAAVGSLDDVWEVAVRLTSAKPATRPAP